MSEQYQEKSPRKGRKRVWTAIWILLALLLAAGLAAAAYYNAMLSKINHVSVPEVTYTRPVEEESVPAPEEDSQPSAPEDYVNILLIGQDSRAGESARLADTMILCTVNTREKTLTTTSILRDSFIPRFSYRGRNGGNIKLTTIYNLGYLFGDGIAGSMELMNQVLFENFGIEVDHDVEVDFEAFIRVVDILGGIDLELTEAEADYMNADGNLTDYHFEPGMAHLEGRPALVYVRMRKAAGDGESDITRTRRQRAAIEAILGKVKDTDLFDLQRMVNEVLPLVTTSMSKSDITDYLLQLLPLLPDLKFEGGGTCPEKYWGELVDIYHDGVMHSVLKFDQAETIKTMRQITEGETPAPPAE